MGQPAFADKKSLREYKEKQKAEDELRKKQLTRKEFLKEQILGHDRIDLLMTEVLGYEVMDFHVMMYYHRKYKHKKIGKQKWHLALAPRGGGKSTILTISSIIMDVLKDADIRILICSKTDENAVGMLSAVKQHLVSEELVSIFGEQKGDTWNEGEINIKGKKKPTIEKTIETRGVGSAIASRHYDKIYADDLCDEENSKTETQRMKLRTWFFKTVNPTMMADASVSFVGTRYNPEDLWGFLIENTLTKKNKAGKVIKKYYINIPALIKKRFRKPNAPEHKKFISFWPEVMSVDFLLQMKHNQGTIIFNSQMQNDVEAMKGKIFKYDWFNWYQLDDINTKELKIYEGVDLAIKQQDTADKFAHVTIGVHPKTLNIYVLDYYNRVTHYSTQKKIIWEKFLKWDAIRTGIEANGYQRALIQDMRTDLQLQNVRAVPIFTETDKTIRAWKLSAYFERGQVYFLPWMHTLAEHLLQMPDGRYKDLFDALDLAIQTAFFSKKKIRETEPGLI